jgi:hypothetical protein
VPDIFTVRVGLQVTPPEVTVYVIVVDPAVLAVSTPVLELIVATEVFELDQEPPDTLLVKVIVLFASHVVPTIGDVIVGTVIVIKLEIATLESDEHVATLWKYVVCVNAPGLYVVELVELISVNPVELDVVELCHLYEIVAPHLYINLLN